MLPRTLIIALLSLLVAVPAAGASTRQLMTFEAPSELLDDATRDATLDEIAGFGVDRVRVLVYWQDFAPNVDARTHPGFDTGNPDLYPAGTWDRLDRLFAAAGARGISVQPTLTGPGPRWATRDKKDRVSFPSPVEFGKFAAAVGRRYGDRVGVWSIWNEPNHPQFLRPQFVRGKPRSPRIYRLLYKAAVRGLKVSPANAHDKFLLGETAPRGTPRVVAPLSFLRNLARGSGRLEADGYAHHAYTTKKGPFFKPPDRDDVTIGVLSRLTRELDRQGRIGRLPKKLGVYLTEFGIQSEPDPYVGVSLTRQAEYLAIAEHMAWSNPRVKSFSQYLLRDDQPRPGSRYARYSGFESGLRRSDGSVKPAWHGFRLPLHVDRRGSKARIWGLVRPSRGGTSVELLAGDEVIRTITTNSRGAFEVSIAHKAGRRYRIRWTAPDGTVFTGAAVRAY